MSRDIEIEAHLDTEAEAAFLGFLGACLDSVDYGRRTGREGENADMFPAELTEALASAGISSDDLAMIRI